MKLGKKGKGRLLFYVAVFVAVLIVVGFFMQIRMRQLLYHFMELQVMNQAGEISRQVQTRFDVELRDLEELSAGITLAEQENGDFIRENGRYLFPRSIEGMTAGLLAIDGSALCGDALDFSAFSGIQDSFRGNPALSYNAADGLLFTVPVYHGNNVRYVLYRLYTKDILNQGFFEGSFTGAGDVAVVDIREQEIVPLRNGKLTDITVGKDLSSYRLLQEKMSVSSSAAVLVDAEEAFLFMAEVSGYGMYLIGIVPEVVLSEGVVSLITLVLWVFALLILLMVIGIAYLFNMEARAKESDDLRMAKQMAEEANQAKSTFLAQMSHEIRTPINAVLGMNEMILRESTQETVQEYATNAYNAGKALLSIINDILDISKIEAGKLEIMNADYELYSLVSDCYHMTADRAEKKGLSFGYSVDETLPTKLKGDMFHIRQIVVNFITNAIKYTDAGRVELIVSGSRTEAGFALEISVRDTGIGLTKESQENLFESFRRFDLKRNRSVEGTGLGLSICKQLAELMGGKVFVQSEYGKGSTFGCRIPQQIVDDKPVGRMALNLGAKRTDLRRQLLFVAREAHILVVDDVEMNITVFKSLLKCHQMQIDSALGGRQCLEMIGRKKYDLIFMDHMMPEMDGVETYEQMKHMEHPNQDTPVIMLTANAIQGEREKYTEAGFAHYLTKPIQSDKLDETLLRFLPQEMILWEDSGDDGVFSSKQEAGAEKELQRSAGSDVIDVGLGLSYSGNQEEAYMTILGSFVKSGADNAERIRSFCGEEAWKDYVIAVHALKSTSLAIGARSLSKKAQILEAAGKAGDYGRIREENGALLELYGNVLEAGKDILESYGKKAADGGRDRMETAGDAPREISADQLAAIRERLKNALTAFDDEEFAAVLKEMSRYTFGGSVLAERFAKVKALVEDFEYQDAGDLAEGIFEEMTAGLQEGSA